MTTLTVMDPLPRGTWIRLDDEDRPFKVTDCTGRGPFALTVRPVTRWDRWLVRIKAWLRRPREWWLDTRCLPDHGWCWRKATVDCLCDRHSLIENGERARAKRRRR